MRGDKSYRQTKELYQLCIALLQKTGKQTVREVLDSPYLAHKHRQELDRITALAEKLKLYD